MEKDELRWFRAGLVVLFFACAAWTRSQQPPSPRLPGEPDIPTAARADAASGAATSPLGQPALSPGVLFLFDLERKFVASVATGGGKAFASWFADDAVTLNNGKTAVLGRGNIAAQTTWNARDYQLTWVPEGGQMMPSGDAGFTWGRYEGRGKDRQGGAVVTSGRYITLWKKTAGGEWKVAMDASANEPAEAGACCTLPKP